jgi:hypothetical protein
VRNHVHENVVTVTLSALLSGRWQTEDVHWDMDQFDKVADKAHDGEPDRDGFAQLDVFCLGVSFGAWVGLESRADSAFGDILALLWGSGSIGRVSTAVCRVPLGISRLEMTPARRV